MSGGCKRYSLGALQDWMGTWRTLLWDHVTYLITTKATIGASLWLGGKELTSAGDMGLIPGWGKSPGEGNGNPFQHSCLENSMDGGDWQATVHGIAKSWTPLSDFTSLQAFV